MGAFVAFNLADERPRVDDGREELAALFEREVQSALAIPGLRVLAAPVTAVALAGAQIGSQVWSDTKT